MSLTQEQVDTLQDFFQSSHFDTKGAVITDLDGTVVHEFEGRTVIHQSVEIALKKIYELGRPVVINTLRFPLSVIRTFGKEWYKISGSSIPVILLNGSQLGYIKMEAEELVFEQLVAFPLSPDEVFDIAKSAERLIKAGIEDFILFYYPEDWREGEIIWTPDKNKIDYLREKYRSASQVISTTIEELGTLLQATSICMIFMLIEAPEDQLMAYQHTKRNNFLTRRGINKSSGSKEMADRLGFELEHSIGAGDSEMDVFLREVGLAVHVRNPELPYEGKVNTVRVQDFPGIGDLMNRLASLQRHTIIT